MRFALSGSPASYEGRDTNKNLLEKQALPVLAYPVNSIRQCALLPPRGYVYQPRVAAQQLPWVVLGRQGLRNQP